MISQEAQIELAKFENRGELRVQLVNAVEEHEEDGRDTTALSANRVGGAVGETVAKR